MRYCTKCIQPDTRPGIVFDEEGVCLACRAAELRAGVDWSERERELEEIAQWAKDHMASYDAVVGVSGGKDSIFQAIYSKKNLGLHCLLVNCAPDNISFAGAANLENLVQQGFDMISIRPNPKIERHLSRRHFFQSGNFVKPLEYPLYASAFNMALKFGIPLVIQGENAAETLGVNTLDPGGDAVQFGKEHTVRDSPDIFLDGTAVRERDLVLYRIPGEEELRQAGIRAVFLGHYAREWSNHRNTLFAVEHGLTGRPGHDPMATGRTNPYFSLDADLKIVNQNVLKYFKLGFGGVTDELCYDIREGLLTRDEAVRLAQRYDGRCSDRYIQEFCDYLDITLYSFWKNVHSWTNKSLFRWDEGTGGYVPKFTVGTDFEEESP